MTYDKERTTGAPLGRGRTSRGFAAMQPGLAGRSVIPAKAGIQALYLSLQQRRGRDPRLSPG
jgi:hypothetical protein